MTALCRRLLVVVGAGGEPLHLPRHARRLRPPVPAVLQVDVVDDLRKGSDPRRRDREPPDEHLEGAGVAFVGVFRVEHVEAQLPSHEQAR